MKAIFKNNVLEIDADYNEQLEIIRHSIYPDRVIVFKTVNDILQEIHFDNSNGTLINRQQRKLLLPKFEYRFDEQNIIGIIEHKFLDEIDFKDYMPKDIDVETTTIKLIKIDKVVSDIYHMHPINKFQDNYYEEVKSCVERFVKNEKEPLEYKTFLVDEYSKWTAEEKANYHYNSILFQERMQGGYPSRYKNPAATYLSKWFIDEYSAYDNNIYSTLEQIANMFDIDTKFLKQMTQHKTESTEWKDFAYQLNLIEK